MSKALGDQEQGLSWLQTWIMAITQPTEATYAEIANDPGASQRRAYSWIMLASAIGFVIYLLIDTLRIGEFTPDFPFLVLFYFLASVFLAMVVIMISAGLSQWIASAWGGAGSYAKLLYPVAAYSAPIVLISAMLLRIPYVTWLVLPLVLYEIYLNVTAIKAVNQFGWGKAIASSGLMMVLLSTVLVVLVALPLLDPDYKELLFSVILER